MRDGDGWIVNGSKTFISSGFNCDLVVVVTRTDPAADVRIETICGGTTEIMKDLIGRDLGL